MGWWGFAPLLLLSVGGIRAEILTPPYFNLAEGKEIIASATCGVDTPGAELYCKLVGANSDQHEDINLIQGQVCDFCDPSVPEKSHPPEHAVDGMETWWQSPPLSRGMKYNEVNLTINLGQEFHVAYVYIRMGNSPRPGLWVLEKSKDYGKTWQPWQYFSDSEADCITYFGVDSHTPITRDDSVICTTEYSKIVPLEGGEIPISILNNRPSASHYFNSTLLQEWTRATNVRFRFLRTKNLLGHLMSVARQDPTVTRRYFYSIKDISIGGRCMCNGHADTCDIRDPNQANKLECICQHNTYGPQCASCLPGFQQKKWRQSTASHKFVCEPCNCFGHSNDCIYNRTIDELRLSLDIHGLYEGGGVCQNCQDNTEGINCNKCKPKFYRPRGKPLNATDVCQPCDCNQFYSTGNCAESSGKCECRKEFTSPDCDSCAYGYFGYPDCRPCDCHLGGTEGYHCEAIDGYCPCKANYAGHYCNLCAEGYYNFPDCLPCQCNPVGSSNDVCNVLTGNCTCKNNFQGRTCDTCEHGYFNYPQCSFCNCDTRGTEVGICSKDDGKCLCKEGYGGARCDQCIIGYYGYPNCRPCNCSTVGSSSVSCDASGKCSCLGNFAGRTCNQCSPGYFNYPECVSCDCDSHGSIGISCDNDGKCQCQENFDGDQCNTCKEGFYNFPRCEGCNCDPAGVVKSFMGCGSLPAGELCQCKTQVQGRICNQCKPMFWNLQQSNPDGCEDCNCNIPGVIGGIGECDPRTGQCICKPGVTNRACSQCVDGTYDLQGSNLFGCSVCNCDIGGSISSICDKQSGQCACQPRVTGLTCKEPLQAHYFPTLHQFQYEVEDGRTPSNNAVRYGYAEDSFPGYSWKGYAVFSDLQDEIIHRVYIQKSSLYRMVLRFVNKNNEPVLGDITITPDSPSEVEQKFKVQFKSADYPEFVTVAGVHGNHPEAMVMNPGYWSISIKTGKNLFLDYFVLLPAEYYEATRLTQDVDVPCEIGQMGLCRHYGYPSVAQFDSVRGSGGFVNDHGVRLALNEYFDDVDVLEEMRQDEIPMISNHQQTIHFELRVTKPGAHVLLVTYVTYRDEMSTSVVNIEANTVGKGKVTLHPCRYTSICRQVVTDRLGKVAAYSFPTNFVSIVLTGETDSNVAIESVVAIPYDHWSLDYVKPKSVCVRTNGKCVQGMFPGAADAKKVEFETSNEALDVDPRPTGIFDSATKLIYLGNSDSVVNIETKVPRPGDYVFVIQYYQPDHPEFEVDVLIQNGKFYEAKAPVPHCPSNSGCRSIIRQQDGNSKFNLIENVVLTFQNPKHNIWLDYMLIIPVEQYNEKVLKKIQFDQTKEFLKRCGNNHFYINTTEEGFCRDSIFSLTADYNSGALNCACSLEGTTSFECEKFGGQCPCKPNIIGRRCDICKTGFYGYPNCRPCNCPSTALCEPETGECICPSRVTGERCDRCEEGTYGFHPIIGCEECNCMPQGVLNGNLQCDLLNGTCSCKYNVVGRQCDRCRPGHSQFPYCVKCDCDIRGTTEDVCDQSTAECHCKANVQGSACDVCEEGTFNLQPNNEEGCSKCFCFGKTTRCVSANLYRSYIFDMLNWDIALVQDKTGEVTTLESSPQEYNDTSIIMNLAQNETFNNVIYFSAPQSYLGKRLTSYGGFLNYTIHYSTGPFGKAVAGPDVVLLGADSVVFYYGDEQPPSFTNFPGSVELIETNFFTTKNQQVSREQLLVLLENLKGIYIRATYWEASIKASLSEVTLDTTTELYSKYSVLANSVEQCQCPPNYQGLSCEECAPGYYRVESGPYGGSCVKCQCNGHAETCDVKTGVCHDCKNGTTGDHCELCEEGYYGNATMGTPSDCLICACPLPIPSNNFATSCEVNEAGNKISCSCFSGYYGARCESCAAGFYGDPNIEGDFCKPCQCSGNIDTNEIGSCDSITGECLHCLNNTYGEACNLCAPGFFGDAVERKNCQSCSCTQCGMDKCDSYTGRCQCKPNVVGESCDRCAVNHYGFDSCTGCQACNCGLASEESQCDEVTGQCKCKPGVTGRSCDRCIAGYWNYGPEGCSSCGCNTGYSIGASCDTATGQCSCLPGVIGEKCDHCPFRWVLKEGDGCYQCDSCIHDLLDVTDDLQSILAPVAQEFNSVAESYYTNQRLKFVNDTVNELYPKVRLLDPSRINLTPVQVEIGRLDQEVLSQKRRVEYTAETSKQWKDGAENTLNDMNDLESDVEKEIRLVHKIIAEVQSLATNIASGDGAKIDSALKEAQEILSRIQGVSFIDFRDKATDQSINANVLMSEMLDYNVPVHNLSSLTSTLDAKLEKFDNKLDDFIENAGKADELARSAKKLIDESKRVTELGNFEMIRNATAETEDDVSAGDKLNRNATELLASAVVTFESLDDLTKVQDETFSSLNEILELNDDGLLDSLDTVQRATDHAEDLHRLSLELDDVLTGTRNTSAVRAVSAYRDIEMAIQVAKNAAAEATEAADNATSLSRGIGNKSTGAYERAQDLNQAADNALTKTHGTLEEDLDQAKEDAKILARTNRRNEENLDRINSTLNNLQVPMDSLIEEAMKEAQDIEDLIQRVQNHIKDVPDRVSEDLQRSKNLSKDRSDSIRDISQAKKQLDSVSKVVPDMSDLLNRLGEKQRAMDRTGNDLKAKIEALKMKIANARELADRFKTGLTFYRNTTLELKNPESLPLLATSTKLSVYFKTNKTNGFLLYLGNEARPSTPRQKTHDFLALMIESGYPVLVIDLGSGPVKIVNNKFVSDNVWRQIIVDRTGKNVKLIVREDVGGIDKYQEFIEEQVLKRTSSIFDLDQKTSKLFVGGYDSSFQMQDAVTASSFEGEMEDLVVGDVPVSFWNFKKGENNRQVAMERDKLVDFTPATGYRFDRNGYAIIGMKNSNIRYDQHKSGIKMSFKTLSEDGLMFLMGKGKQFFALEMRNGQILYQFSLGEGTFSLISPNKYNDGQWHMVEARRLGGAGALDVDGAHAGQNASQGDAKVLVSTDHVYVGGYPPNIRHQHKSVSNIGFEGCIDQLSILDTPVDLTKNLQAFGVMPGCPTRFASLVSFEEDAPGYVRWSNLSADSTLQINLKFKTLAKDAIIFYATNSEQTTSSVLRLEDGVLTFRSHGEDVSSSLAGNKFNDNEWHVVTATHENDALRLDIDDSESYSNPQYPPPLNIKFGNLYIGGIPNAERDSFIGCIGDATVNGEIINFAGTKERPNAQLDKCLGGEGSSSPVTERQPAVWPPPLVTDVDAITMANTEANIVHVEIDHTGELEREGEGRVTIPPGTEEPVIPTRPPESDQCKLPYLPEEDPDSENALRFGTAKNSRLEYRSLSGTYRDEYDFQIDVKTMADEGIIFYTSEITRESFIAVYVKNGRVHHTFDCGSGPALLQSEIKINDNQWHTIVFKRRSTFGELIVDDQPPVAGYSQGDVQALNVNPPFYVGGIIPEMATSIHEQIGINKTFSGCLGNFMMNGQSLGEPEEKIGVIRCSKRVEPGLFFYPGNGSNLFKAMDKFIVGKTIDIQMDIKPRSMSGHLLSIHGKRDFILLEMVNGTIKFLVKTGKGSIETSFDPTTKHLNAHSLCDGFWHNIRVTKQKNAVLLSVDHAGAPPSIGAKNIAGVLSKNPIFIGGHPQLGKRLRGSTSHAQYVGCIRNIIINNQEIPLNPERTYGHVTTGVCPTI